MAYISQDEKKLIATRINPILKEYGLKGSLSVRNNSTLSLTIFSGPIDFINNFNETVKDSHYGNWNFNPAIESIQVNEYHYKDHFTGKALEVLSKLVPLMKTDTWRDNSDIMSDYFDVSYYYNVNIGRWNSPYKLITTNTNTNTNAIETTVVEPVVIPFNTICADIEKLQEMMVNLNSIKKYVDVSSVVKSIKDKLNDLTMSMATYK